MAIILAEKVMIITGMAKATGLLLAKSDRTCNAALHSFEPATQQLLIAATALLLTTLQYSAPNILFTRLEMKS